MKSEQMLNTIAPAAIIPAVKRPNPLEPTIFHERWWLNITTGEQCQFAEIEDNGKIVARLPYIMRRKFGIGVADMPQLTHFLGPAIVEGDGKENNKFLRRFDLTRQLIDALPSSSSFYIKCHRDVTDILAFQDRGFRSSVQFTHEVLPQSVDSVWKGMRDKCRNGIRLAREVVTLENDISGANFAAFYNANVEDRGESNHLDMRMVTRLVDQSIARGRGALFAARQPNGNLAGIIFCVWDGTSYYYLMSSRSETAHRGVISLLLWEAISDAMRRGLIFDFDGIYNEGGARLAANFSPTVTPRYVVTRENKYMRVWRAVQALKTEPNYYWR